MVRADPAVQQLLRSTDPSIRYFTLTELLAEPFDSAEVKQARERIVTGRRVRALLSDPKTGRHVSHDPLVAHPGGFGVHPYKKWTGAHWRLVSLVELGISAQDERARAAADQVLVWLTSAEHIQSIKCINGLTRQHASQEGNALAVCSRLGLTDDPRVKQLADSLINAQWPDGGWNCDQDILAKHSSFYESLSPLWGLIEYHRVTYDRKCWQAVDQASELFLSHRLFRSNHTGQVIKSEWLNLHYPLYWHYDILQALLILSRAGKANEPRTQEALDLIEQKQGADGLWRALRYYWAPKGKKGAPPEVVNWGRRGPNEMITLNALRVLKAAGRI